MDVFPAYDDPPEPTFRKNLPAVRQVICIQNPRFFARLNKNAGLTIKPAFGIFAYYAS